MLFEKNFNFQRVGYSEYEEMSIRYRNKYIFMEKQRIIILLSTFLYWDTVLKNLEHKIYENQFDPKYIASFVITDAEYKLTNFMNQQYLECTQNNFKFRYLELMKYIILNCEALSIFQTRFCFFFNKTNYILPMKEDKRYLLKQ